MKLKAKQIQNRIFLTQQKLIRPEQTKSPGDTIGVRKMGENIYIVGDLETGAAPGCGLMAPRVGIAAHLQANVVLRILLGEE